MQQFMRYLMRTIVAGVLFIGPLMVFGLVVVHSIRLVAKVLNPVAGHLPIRPVLGLAEPEIAAALLLIFLGFAVGLIAQTAIAKSLKGVVEKLILSKVPGYTLFKAAAEGVAGMESGSNLKVALARIDDAWLLAFIVEQHADGLLTVFIPSAPTPTAGSIYYLTEEQVKRLDVPVSSAIKCIMQLGVGSRALLEPSGASKAAG